MTNIQSLNFDFSELDVEVSSFNGGYDLHNTITGDHITTCDDLWEAEYFLSAIRQN
jgi:hypothetical protein